MKILKRLLPFLSYEKKRIVLIIIFVAIFVASIMSQPFLIGRALDYALANDFNSFISYIIICSSLAIIGCIAGYLFEYFTTILTQNIVYKIRYQIFEKINMIPISYFSSSSSGKILYVQIVDVDNVTNGLNSLFKSFIEGGLTIIITLVLMFVLNWLLALGVVILSPLSIFVARFISKSNHKYFKENLEYQSKINSLSKECINNIDLIQSNNYENEFTKKYDILNQKLKKHGNIALFSASWINPSTRLVNNIIYALIGVIGIILITTNNDFIKNINATISIGGLASFLVYINQYSKPFNEISSAAVELENAATSLERINHFMNVDNDIDNGQNMLNKIETISFDSISFSYDKTSKLIENFSLDINDCTKVAIVGPTGAGKTTLINLLLRYFDIDKGDILYNKESYKTLSKECIRNNIGLVLQESWIFKGTIFDNIRYSKPNATDEEIIEVCKKTNIDKFINLLPFGYETLVSSKEGLSEGEKQLICIARLMLSKPNIVILDEATSNIDTRSEKLINDAFDILMENKTSIIIAHRLSTIVSADVILVLKDGNIVEKGTHKELMEKHGFYHELYSSQFDVI